MKQSVLYFTAAGLFLLVTAIDLFGHGRAFAMTFLSLAGGAAFLWLGFKERRLGR